MTRAQMIKALTPLVVACLAVLVVYWPTAVSMAEVWDRSNTYAHGWVIPPISLWLMWRERAALRAVPLQPSWWGLLPLGASMGLWLAGDLVAVNAATQLALVGMLVSMVPLLLGWRAARVWWFPLAFLFLAVPVGDFMLPVLMSWTADFTVLALRWSGVPVYREGLEFIIPSGSWSVVEACSGIRYLITGFMAGCLYGYLNYRSNWLRLKFVGLAVLVALLANWLRAYLIVMLGHHSGNTIATGVDHLIYGWFFFAIVLMILFWLGGRWTEPDAPPTPTAPTTSATSAMPLPSQGSTGRGWPALLLAGVLLATPLMALEVFRLGVSSQPVDVRLPPAAPGWQVAQGAEALPDWGPTLLNPSLERHQVYERADGVRVGLHVGYFRQQGPQRKLVTSSNTVVSGDKEAPWALVSQAQATVQVDGRPLPVRAFDLRSTQGGLMAQPQRLRLYQWYWLNGRLTASDVRAKLWGAADLVLGRGDDGAILTVYALQGHDTEALLNDFMRAHGDALMAALMTARTAARGG